MIRWCVFSVYVSVCLSTYVCVLCFIEKGFCIRGDLCQFDHGVDPVVIDDVLPGQPLPAEQPSAAAASVPVTHSLSGPTVVFGVSLCVLGT